MVAHSQSQRHLGVSRVDLAGLSCVPCGKWERGRVREGTRCSRQEVKGIKWVDNQTFRKESLEEGQPSHGAGEFRVEGSMLAVPCNR